MRSHSPLCAKYREMIDGRKDVIGEFLAWLLASPRQGLRKGHSRHAALTRPAPSPSSQDAQDSPIPHSPQRLAILVLAPEVKNYAAIDDISLLFDCDVSYFN
jgi:hypothetical protein